MSRHLFPASVEGLIQQCTLLSRKIPRVGAVFLEYRFHPNRKFRADVCFPELKIICEYNGMYGMGRAGGHQTFKGLRKDYEKSNESQLCGYLYLQFEANAVRTGEAMLIIHRAIEARIKEQAE